MKVSGGGDYRKYADIHSYVCVYGGVYVCLCVCVCVCACVGICVS